MGKGGRVQRALIEMCTFTENKNPFVVGFSHCNRFFPYFMSIHFNVSVFVVAVEFSLFFFIISSGNQIVNE